jgi:hypothetical protein
VEREDGRVDLGVLADAVPLALDAVARAERVRGVLDQQEVVAAV